MTNIKFSFQKIFHLNQRIMILWSNVLIVAIVTLKSLLPPGTLYYVFSSFLYLFIIF